MNLNVKPPPSRKSGKSAASIDSDFGRGTQQNQDGQRFIGDGDTISSNLDRASRELKAMETHDLL